MKKQEGCMSRRHADEDHGTAHRTLDHGERRFHGHLQPARYRLRSRRRSDACCIAIRCGARARRHTGAQGWRCPSVRQALRLSFPCCLASRSGAASGADQRGRNERTEDGASQSAVRRRNRDYGWITRQAPRARSAGTDAGDPFPPPSERDGGPRAPLPVLCIPAP